MIFFKNGIIVFINSIKFVMELQYSEQNTKKMSCMDSLLLMPHPCRFLQKYTNFGKSDMQPLIFLKSPSNIAKKYGPLLILQSLYEF